MEDERSEGVGGRKVSHMQEASGQWSPRLHTLGAANPKAGPELHRANAGHPEAGASPWQLLALELHVQAQAEGDTA